MTDPAEGHAGPSDDRCQLELAALRAAIRDDPAPAAPWISLSRLMRWAGHRRIARAAAISALARDPEAAAAWAAFAAAATGSRAEGNGETERSRVLRSATMAYRADADADSRTLADLGRAGLDAGQNEPDAALVKRFLLQSLALAPDAADPRRSFLELSDEPAPIRFRMARTLAALVPADPFGHWAMAGLGDALGDTAGARLGFRRVVALRPAHEGARFMTSCLALGEGLPPTRAPARHVAALFDGYAGRFDAHLTTGLGYDAPARIARALAAGGPLGRHVLDLGCGTGLVAKALQAEDERGMVIDGCDLSAGMLRHARATGLYRHLWQADALEALTRLTDSGISYRTVIAADMLIYLGDLGPFFLAAAAVLAPGGRLAVTLERLDAEDGPAWRLRSTGRFAHRPAAIAALAGQAGLAVLSEEDFPLRRDGNDRAGAIPGSLLILRRNGA